MIVGVISDTHGLLRPEAVAALSGADHIVHAGDVGDIRIVSSLLEIAPLTVIRGNVDVQGPCADLPPSEAVELFGKLFYVVHSVQDLDIDPKIAGVDVVVSGHSHRAKVEVQDEVLYLNPGSAGPRRFSLPVTIALIHIDGPKMECRIVDLEPA